MATAALVVWQPQNSGTWEPTALEYARLHNLTVDYLAKDPLLELHACERRVKYASFSLNRASTPEIEDGAVEPDRERIIVLGAALELLRDVCTAPDVDLTPPSPTLPAHRARRWKQELPLLTTDPEYDLLHFGRRAVPYLTSYTLDPLPVDEELDGGPTWPTKYAALPEDVNSQMRKEKLEIGKASLVLLRDTIMSPDACPGEFDLQNLDFDYQRRSAIAPVSPPLLPLSPPLNPFVPCTPLGGIAPVPSEDDCLDAESETIAKQLSREDTALFHKGSMATDIDQESFDNCEEFNFLDRVEETPPFSSSPKRRLGELKVDGPLTPPLLPDYPNKRLKMESLQDAFECCNVELPSSFLKPEDLSSAVADIDEFMRDQIEPLAMDAVARLEREQLVQADATGRVKVPAIESRGIIAPWKFYSSRTLGMRGNCSTELERQSRLLQDLKLDMDLVRTWHGNSRLERLLLWTPFPMHLAKVDLDEHIDADAELDQLIATAEVHNVIDSASDFANPEGLRVLRDAWELDEEDLEMADFDAEDMRNLSGRQTDAHKPSKVSDAIFRTRAAHPGTNVSDLHQSPLETSQNAVDNGLMFGGSILSSAEVTSYLNSKGKDRDVAANPPHSELNQKDTGHAAPVGKVERKKADPPSTVVTQDLVKRKQLPHPVLSQKQSERCFIVCSSLFSTRKPLMRAVEMLYPNANFIERMWDRPHGFSKSHRSAAMPDEGDIIVSPATTILLTTLSKIKQQPLPGREASHFGIKERIANVSSCFARVIVLVSEAAGTEFEPYHVLDTRDTNAIAVLAGFASTLEAEVQVFYVPGGEPALANWVVGIMGRYGVEPVEEEDNVTLLPEQTLWERFLRCAGMNAFAAQVVLTALKPGTPQPITDHNSVSSRVGTETQVSGLAALVQMAPDARLARFSSFMSRQQVLSVNSLLEQSWMGDHKDLS